MGDVISSATGAVASLTADGYPARQSRPVRAVKPTARFRPTLTFDKAQYELSGHVEEAGGSHRCPGRRVQAAVGEEYQNALSGTKRRGEGAISN